MDDVKVLVFKVAILLVVGMMGALFSRKYNLPSVTGYIIFGLILGPSLGLIFPSFKGFITVDDANSLSFFNDITLGFIGFAIGGELSYQFLKKAGKSIMTITAFEVIGAVAVVFFALLFIPKPDPIMIGYQPFSANNIAFSLILASMSAATAPAATLMVVKQFRAHGPLTKAIVPITAMDDISGITVFGFATSISVILINNSPVSVLMILQPIIEIVGSILIGAIIGLAVLFISKKTAKTKDNYLVYALISILLTNTLIFFLNDLMENIGISFSQIFANIILGAVIANIGRNSEKTFDALSDFTTPFFIIFFTLAGATLDLNIIKSDIFIVLIAVAYIIARGTGIVLGTSVGARITKQPDTLKKYLGFALLPQGGVSLSLLVVVKRLFFNTRPEFYNIILTVVMLSILFYETTGPIFSKFALAKAGEINGLDRFEDIAVDQEYVVDTLPQEMIQQTNNDHFEEVYHGQFEQMSEMQETAPNTDKNESTEDLTTQNDYEGE